jgi:four helix bundle protein
MNSYRDLKVWQEAMTLAERIYSVTADFPASERYGLIAQMRRAAVSVPSNIAEGYGRKTSRQRYNFLEIALGSLFELETQSELSSRLGFAGAPVSEERSEKIRGIGRGLTALMRYVEDEARLEPARRNQLTTELPEELRGTRGTPRNSS